MTTPQPEPRVSDEDRETAIDAAVEQLRAGQLTHTDRNGRFETTRVADVRAYVDEILDGLISHGWGPRPTVNGATLDHIADGYLSDHHDGHINFADLPAILRECGIDVVPDKQLQPIRRPAERTEVIE